jgi:hypothetical protein
MATARSFAKLVLRSAISASYRVKMESPNPKRRSVLQPTARYPSLCRITQTLLVKPTLAEAFGRRPVQIERHNRARISREMP